MGSIHEIHRHVNMDMHMDMHTHWIQENRGYMKTAHGHTHNIKLLEVANVVLAGTNTKHKAFARHTARGRATTQRETYTHKHTFLAHCNNTRVDKQHKSQSTDIHISCKTQSTQRRLLPMTYAPTTHKPGKAHPYIVHGKTHNPTHPLINPTHPLINPTHPLINP